MFLFKWKKEHTNKTYENKSAIQTYKNKRTFQKCKEKTHIPHQRMFLPLSLLMNAKVGSVHFWDILTQKWGGNQIWQHDHWRCKQKKTEKLWSVLGYTEIPSAFFAKYSIWKYTSTMPIFMKTETVLNFLCQPTLPNFIKTHLAFLILKCGETVSSMYIQLCTSCKEHTISNKYTCTSITEIHYFQKLDFTCLWYTTGELTGITTFHGTPYRLNTLQSYHTYLLIQKTFTFYYVNSSSIHLKHYSHLRGNILIQLTVHTVC